MSPGPATKEQMALQKFMLIKLKKKKGRNALPKSSVIENKQTEFHYKIESLIAENHLLEKRIPDTEMNGRKLEARLDDLKNRSRRMHLVFLGIPHNAVRES